jgi:hypothetical protein
LSQIRAPGEKEPPYVSYCDEEDENTEPQEEAIVNPPEKGP